MTANLPAPAQPEKPAPTKRITAKIKAAISALVEGNAKNITQAAGQAGLSRSHLSRELSRPHIHAHLLNKTKRHLATQAARAGAVKTELMESANDMVRDRASSFVLGLAGIALDAGSGGGGSGRARAGYLIDLSEPQQPGLQIVIVQGEKRHLPEDAPGLTIDVTPNPNESQNKQAG